MNHLQKQEIYLIKFLKIRVVLVDIGCSEFDVVESVLGLFVTS